MRVISFALTVVVSDGVRKGVLAMNAYTDISRTRTQFFHLVESMGLDPIEILGPDVDKSVRMLVAHGKACEALEREEMQRRQITAISNWHP